MNENIIRALRNLYEAQDHLRALDCAMRNSPGLTVDPAGTLERARRSTHEALTQIEMAQDKALREFDARK